MCIVFAFKFSFAIKETLKFCFACLFIQIEIFKKKKINKQTNSLGSFQRTLPSIIPLAVVTVAIVVVTITISIRLSRILLIVSIISRAIARIIIRIVVRS